MKTEEGEGRFLLSVSINLRWLNPCGIEATTDTWPTQGIWTPETDFKCMQFSQRAVNTEGFSEEWHVGTKWCWHEW